MTIAAEQPSGLLLTFPVYLAAQAFACVVIQSENPKCAMQEQWRSVRIWGEKGMLEEQNTAQCWWG